MVISAARCRMPATKLWPSADSSNEGWNRFLPFLFIETDRCSPLPGACGSGLGRKDANRPLEDAMDLTTHLKVTKLSAASRASA